MLGSPLTDWSVDARSCHQSICNLCIYAHSTATWNKSCHLVVCVRNVCWLFSQWFQFHFRQEMLDDMWLQECVSNLTLIRAMHAPRAASKWNGHFSSDGIVWISFSQLDFSHFFLNFVWAYRQFVIWIDIATSSFNVTSYWKGTRFKIYGIKCDCHTLNNHCIYSSFDIVRLYERLVTKSLWQTDCAAFDSVLF